MFMDCQNGDAIPWVTGMLLYKTGQFFYFVIRSSWGRKFVNKGNPPNQRTLIDDSTVF